MVSPVKRELILDISVIPPNFSNCKIIDFAPTETSVVTDFLRLITLSQGHIIDPTLLERFYLETKCDLRQTLTQTQFWCQFGVGDTRAGTQWINWGGELDEWVISRGTILDGVQWRQDSALGLEYVLGAVEEEKGTVDLEEVVFPRELDDMLFGSPVTMFKRQKSTLAALTGISEFLE